MASLRKAAPKQSQLSSRGNGLGLVALGSPGVGFAAAHSQPRHIRDPPPIPILTSHLPGSLGQAPPRPSPCLEIKRFRASTIRSLLAQGFGHRKWISQHNPRGEKTGVGGHLWAQPALTVRRLWDRASALQTALVRVYNLIELSDLVERAASPPMFSGGSRGTAFPRREGTLLP